MTIHIEGYLIQEKLVAAIKEVVDKNWIGREYKLQGTRYRFDMAANINNQVVVIEFDGYQHYQDAFIIKRDKEKNMLAAQHNIKVVRIPYWVQLTSETLNHYLGLNANIEQNFPHGFITTKHFPATFCELGVKRFQQELNSLPTSVRNDVIKSLRDQTSKYDIDYVVPSSIRHILVDPTQSPPMTITERVARIQRITNEIKQFATDDSEPLLVALAEITADSLVDDMMETMVEVYQNDSEALEPCPGCAAELITDTNRLHVFVEGIKEYLQSIRQVVHQEDKEPLPSESIPTETMSNTIH